jgi:hypothetical protein
MEAASDQRKPTKVMSRGEGRGNEATMGHEGAGMAKRFAAQRTAEDTLAITPSEIVDRLTIGEGRSSGDALSRSPP